VASFLRSTKLLAQLAIPLLLLLLLQSSLTQHATLSTMHVISGGLMPPAGQQQASSSSSSAGGSSSVGPGSSSSALGLPGPTLDAVLVAYNNPKAFLSTLASYREAYPEGKLVVICDDGCLDFGPAARHFGAVWDGIPRRLTTKTDPGFYLRPPQMENFMAVLRHSILPHLSADFFMLLETDVRVERRVQSPLNYTLNGIVRVTEGWFVGGPPVFAAYLNPSFALSNFPLGHAPYGGQGGSILSREFMLRAVNIPAAQQAEDFAVLYGCSTTLGVDYVLSALVYRYNGTCGPYAGYEDWANAETPGRYARGEVEVYHPDKSEYNVPLTEWDLEILGPNYTQVLTTSQPLPQPRVNEVCDLLKGVDYSKRLGSAGLGGLSPHPGTALL
jgi:hypothetical protein